MGDGDNGCLDPEEVSLQELIQKKSDHKRRLEQGCGNKDPSYNIVGSQFKSSSSQ